jgi:hypothetical protein
MGLAKIAERGTSSGRNVFGCFDVIAVNTAIFATVLQIG